MATENKPRRMDAHQHFWRYTDAEFGWIDDTMATIRRDFLPSDLKPLMDEAGVDATIAVQARQSLEETHWLLELAGQNRWIAGVVGWVPLASSDVPYTLDSMVQNKSLKGVRHVLQGEADEYMEFEDFNAGIDLLREYSLVYDVLILERQLPAATRFVDRHPNQPFVLDHLAKPRIAAQELEPWRSNIIELARRPHISCKISGMVTEAKVDQWTLEDLRPYVETVLEAFGPDRILFGSDWPVCTVACGYSKWVTTVGEFVAQLSTEEQGQILGLNVVRIYGL